MRAPLGRSHVIAQATGRPGRVTGEGPGYLRWAVACFRLSAAVVSDATQIHTHMCYSEFNDIIESIAAMDADVISIETARSNMELLEAFAAFDYPNAIGPGVWDIHSPRIPSAEEMAGLLRRAAARVPHERLWLNPDCGCKTRSWAEVRPAVENLVRRHACCERNQPEVRIAWKGGAASGPLRIIVISSRHVSCVLGATLFIL